MITPRVGLGWGNYFVYGLWPSEMCDMFTAIPPNSEQGSGAEVSRVWGKRNDVAWLPVFSVLPGFLEGKEVLSGPRKAAEPCPSMLHWHNEMCRGRNIHSSQKFPLRLGQVSGRVSETENSVPSRFLPDMLTDTTNNAFTSKLPRYLAEPTPNCRS